MTFTILGRDPVTGRLGGAVTTSDLAVGARVLFAAAGVGVAATQHRTDPRLGPAMLDRLRAGDGAQPAVDAVAAATDHREWRQLGAVDATGATGSRGGGLLWPVSAELAGEQCMVLGNMLVSDAVAPAIREGFTTAAARGDDLGQALVAALAAGERAGGETGPLRSAALLIVDREPFPYADLRVDDDPDPLGRLAALWQAWRPLAAGYVSRALEPDFDGARHDRPADGPGHRPSSTTT
jgi:uncharacterized Ntn-hydrolase superfamily protein